jgi:aminopeptidase
VNDEVVGRYAQLIVEVGANVQPGQGVVVLTELGNEELLRAVADRAYAAGAAYVEPQYLDMHVVRSQIVHAPESALDSYPRWVGERVLALGRDGAAHIWLCGAGERNLLDDLDPARVGRWRPPGTEEGLRVVNDRSSNWTVAGAPSPGWAAAVHPDLPPADALRRLWEDVVVAARLDEPDPCEAWRARMAQLRSIAARLDAQALGELRFEGPGTSLVVGLLPSSAWQTATMSRRDGVEHVVNLPSEELFTTPDPGRTEGTVRATRPLELGGSLVEGIALTFAGGRLVSVEAERGADLLRGRTAADAGAARLGEVALVDREGRVGRLGTVFLDTLYDENAASHVALGQAYELAVGEDDRARINTSAIHVDVMIGGDEVSVTGVTAAGEVPLLTGGEWQL